MLVYMHSNDDQLPVSLQNRCSETLQMYRLNMKAIYPTSLIVRANRVSESRDYLLKVTSSLLALFLYNDDLDSKLHRKDQDPVPLKITKSLERKGVGCFEMEWVIALS